MFDKSRSFAVNILCEVVVQIECELVAASANQKKQAPIKLCRVFRKQMRLCPKHATQKHSQRH
jgi:hypothetical protein